MGPVAGAHVVGRPGVEPARRREHAIRGPDVHSIGGPAEDERLKKKSANPPPALSWPSLSDASELFDTSSDAVAENLAPPSNVRSTDPDERIQVDHHGI